VTSVNNFIWTKPLFKHWSRPLSLDRFPQEHPMHYADEKWTAASFRSHSYISTPQPEIDLGDLYAKTNFISVEPNIQIPEPAPTRNRSRREHLAINAD
jgi:hypothetical protein